MPDTVRFTELKSFFEEVVKAGKIGIWGRVIGVIFRLGRRFGSLEFLSFFRQRSLQVQNHDQCLHNCKHNQAI